MSNNYKIHKNDRASQYALKIVNKEIPSAIPVYNACKRHLNDINKSQSEKFPFYYDYEEANQIIEFSEMLINPNTNEYLELEGFQDFILGSLYGWKDENGYRRFKLANISLARKNGKSMIQAILSIYELVFGESPELRRQIYLGANTQGQASELFEQVEVMMDKVRASDKWVRQQTKMTFNKIEHIPSYSKIEKISEEMKNLDGKNPTIFIWDEAHEATIDRMYKAMRTGMIQQKNGLIVIISTVGYNLNSSYKKLYDDAKKIASGEVTSDRTFSYIAEGIEEDINKPDNWIKSNPLLSNKDVGETMLNEMKEDYKQSVRNNDTLEFIVKNLNIWTQSQENSFIPAKEWEACTKNGEVDIYGKQAYIGIDLAQVNDIAALNFIIPLSDERYYTFSHSFVSNIIDIEMKAKQDKIDYPLFIEHGYMTLSNMPSGFISYTQYIEKMFEIIKQYNLDVVSIQYDNWGMDKFLLEYEQLSKDTPYANTPFIQVPQKYKDLSPPIKEFQMKIYERNIIHDNNPLVNIAINNAITRYDNNRNVILDKQKQANKIDNLIAMITAFYEARFYEYKDNNKGITEDYILSDDFGF